MLREHYGRLSAYNFRANGAVKSVNATVETILKNEFDEEMHR